MRQRGSNHADLREVFDPTRPAAIKDLRGESVVRTALSENKSMTGIEYG